MSTSDLIPPRGPTMAPLVLEIVRDLCPMDLEQLVMKNADGQDHRVGPPPLQKIRAIHHRQALLIAQGKTIKDAAVIVGSTPQRITQLLNDPAFKDLVQYYQDQILTREFEDTVRIHHKTNDLGEMAIDELRERLEDDERRKTIPTQEIRKIAFDALDRTSLPPKSTTNTQLTPTTITLNFGGRGIDKKDEQKIIDVTPDEEKK